MIKSIIIPFLVYLLSNSAYRKEMGFVAIHNFEKYPIGELPLDKTINDMNKKIALSYLKKYELKDLKGIGELFSEDIVLRDWKIRVQGKEQALLETQKNFTSVASIKIEVLSIYENQNTVAAELKIIINHTEELYVIDVITINSEGKISSIKAFIGRGDHLN